MRSGAQRVSSLRRSKQAFGPVSFTEADFLVKPPSTSTLKPHPKTMKKLLTFAFALFFTAGISFAQSVSDIDQEGTSNSGTVTQTVSPAISNIPAAEAYLKQAGTRNSANIEQNRRTFTTRTAIDTDVRQSGERNTTDVSQSGWGGVIDVDQKGLSNSAEVGQSETQAFTADVNQEGDRNQAIASQNSGTGGVIDIDQFGSSNVADVNQDRVNGQSPVYTMARVLQEGELNEADVDQVSATNATADVLQFGDRNDAIVEQFNQTDVDPNHSAYVRQEGSSNFAHLDQSAEEVAAANGADIRQFGTSNQARLDQDGLAGGHTAEIRQEGTGNRLEGLGGAGTFALQAGSGHTLDVFQAGSSNRALVSQMGLSNVGDISQSGTSNVATINQN